MIRNSPGIKMTHQELVKRALVDKESIVPKDTTSVGSPIPKKLSVASIVMDNPTEETIINKTGEIKLGSKWYHKTWKKFPPMILDAKT